MKIRLLCLMLALLMLAVPFVACNKEEEPETPDENPTLELVTEGVSNFVIVRDYKASGQVVDGTNAMKEQFKTFLNAEVEIRECYTDREEADDIVLEKEILIGATNRPETAQVTKNMRSGDYAITIVNGKLVIAGGSDEATNSAIVRFLTGFVADQGDKNSVQLYNSSFSLVVDQKTASQYTTVGKYSYNTAVVANARIDSFAIFYANNAQSQAHTAFANEVKDYINKQTGYVLPVYKDANDIGTNYKILVGDTSLTDPTLIANLTAEQYYIGLKATDDGAVLTILYGDNAQSAAMQALKKMIPALTEPGELNIEAGYVDTNMPQ